MINLLGRTITRSFYHNPVLIIGTGRSGTSILLQALGAHSQFVSVDSESPFIPYVGALLHPFEFRYNKEYHLESLATSREYLYEQFRKLCFESAWGRYYGLRRIVTNRRMLFKSLARAKYWCAKTFPNEVEAMGLSRLYPRIKFVYVFRNGCKVVQSRMKFRGMSDYSFEEDCKVWADSVKKYRYLFTIEQAIGVRQEELAAQPDSVYRKILTFIGANYEDSPTKFSQTTLIHSLNQKTKSDVDVNKELSSREDPFSSWTREQKDIFIDICGEGMRELGYDLPE